MPHILAKINRVHYGLLRPHELVYMAANGTLPNSRRYLAVPFIGKDAPSLASEYAHPDIAIGLTMLSYRYEGVSGHWAQASPSPSTSPSTSPFTSPSTSPFYLALCEGSGLGAAASLSAGWF